MAGTIVRMSQLFLRTLRESPADTEHEYGLAAGVFTQDLQRGHRLASALEAGVVWINTYYITPPEMPFGGVKQSGTGRENGLAAIEHYTQLKSVHVEMGDVEARH